MSWWNDAFDFAFRLLAGMNVFLLLLLYVQEHKAEKRDETAKQRERLLQSKIDLIGRAAGLGEQFALLDQQHGRETGFATLDFPDSTPAR